MVDSYGDSLDDMMIEILTRLPVKSLIRFRCVCKSWYTSFKSPNFIYKHLNNDENTRLVVSYETVIEERGVEYPFSYICLVPDETLVDLSLQDLHPHTPVAIIGPCDGIFFLLNSNTLITLWNLATKEYRDLPKCRASLPRYTKILRSSIGFGIDLGNNDYKLVMILTLWDEKRDTFYKLSHIAMFNFNTNVWRGFKGFEMEYEYLDNKLDSTHLNGVCYWIAMQDFDSKVILSFDISAEVFEEIQTPCNPKSALGNLGLCNGSLALVVLDEEEKCFDLWVMKERCWTKQFTVGPFLEACEPLGLWKKGAFFLESETGQLLLYDPNNKEMRDLGLRALWFSVATYRESLLTIKEDDSLLEVSDIPWHVLGVY